MLYEGVPRKRKKFVKGANKVACARCGIPGMSKDMAWLQADAPGHPHTRALVHKECKDKSNPGVYPTPARAVSPPYVQQAIGITQTTRADDITVTAAIFATTGTATATRAQAIADPTITLTGTGFTTRTYGRIGQDAISENLRVTTYTSATSIAFELETIDLSVGSYWAGAMKSDQGLQGSASIELTIT